MKYVELAAKLDAANGASDEVLKQAFIKRVRRAFVIDLLQEHATGFHFAGTTGDGQGMVRNARANLDVSIVRNGPHAGVIVCGTSRVAQSLMVAYTLLFLMVLFVGLLPGFIETSEGSTAADALVFLIFGIFIFHDIEKKLQEPKEYIQAALCSLEAEFG